MTTLSFKNYYEPTGAAVLQADRPVSAGQARRLVDNVAHLVDESYKYRINWVGGDNADGADNHSPVPVSVVTMWFSTQITRVNRFPRYDIRVATYSEYPGGGTNISASVVPAEYQYAHNDAHGYIAVTAGSVPEGSAWSIDATTSAKSTESVTINPIMPPTYATLRQVAQHMPVRLIIEMERPNTDIIRVIGVQVREYTE